MCFAAPGKRQAGRWFQKVRVSNAIKAQDIQKKAPQKVHGKYSLKMYFGANALKPMPSFL